MKWVILFSCFLMTQNLNSQMDTTSYSAGLILAKNLKSQGINSLDIESFTLALRDVFEGGEIKMSVQEAGAIFRQELERASAEISMAFKKAGEEFLAENAKRPEVVTLSSGLQYEIVTQSESQMKPSLSDKVKVHYHGTLIDGTVFDSSVERNEPIAFPLNGVIMGWQEGLQLMTVGSKYKLYIPYDLAYGANGAGDIIKPYSALIFEVELLAIE